jgi:hypothetical protein
MDIIVGNPLIVAAFLCGVAGIYIVVMRTVRKRKD